jgi:DNA primase
MEWTTADDVNRFLMAEGVKNTVDIIDVIPWYIPSLKQSGRTFRGCCPFHQEDTPSFVVFPDRQTWRCFGECHTGGDVFTFVMKMEKLDFSQVLVKLVQWRG